jgi:hypothetical protein
MSDLQLSLLVIGALVVAAVLVYNQVQQRRLRQRITESFGEARGDVLMSGGGGAQPRIEPQLDGHAAPAPGAGPAEPASAAEIDEVIDCVATLACASPSQPFTPAQVAEVLAGVAACGRSWRAAGYNAAGARWEEVTRAVTGQYTRLKVALQLANRGGPLSVAQLTQLSDALNTLATRFSASLDLPDADRVEADARALDDFCMDVDVSIGVNVVANDEAGFSGARVRALVESEGFQLEPDGVFHLLDAAGNTLLSIANQDAAAPFLPEAVSGISTQGVTLLLEVPRVADADAALARMFELGHSLSVTLKGRLVDDNRALLTVASMEKIRAQLNGIHARMNARGIAPGSARALRLFA